MDTTKLRLDEIAMDAASQLAPTLCKIEDYARRKSLLTVSVAFAAGIFFSLVLLVFSKLLALLVPFWVQLAGMFVAMILWGLFIWLMPVQAKRFGELAQFFVDTLIDHTRSEMKRISCDY